MHLHVTALMEPPRMSKAEWKRFKSARRGYGPDSIKRNNALTKREAAVKVAVAAVAATCQKEEKRWVKRKEELQARARNVEQQAREAVAVRARGYACERWANTYVHGEEGEILPAEARHLSLIATMQDAGVEPRAARRAAAQVRAQTMTSADPDPVVRALAVLSAGTHVWYIRSNGSVAVATVVTVHSCVPPFYTIAFDVGGVGGERQTPRSKLVPM